MLDTAYSWIEVLCKVVYYFQNVLYCKVYLLACVFDSVKGSYSKDITGIFGMCNIWRTGFDAHLELVLHMCIEHPNQLHHHFVFVFNKMKKKKKKKNLKIRATFLNFATCRKYSSYFCDFRTNVLLKANWHGLESINKLTKPTCVCLHLLSLWTPYHGCSCITSLHPPINTHTYYLTYDTTSPGSNKAWLNPYSLYILK